MKIIKIFHRSIYKCGKTETKLVKKKSGMKYTNEIRYDAPISPSKAARSKQNAEKKVSENKN